MHRKLPSELNLHVFSFLSSEEVLNAKSIDKKNHSLANNNMLWKTFLARDFAITKEATTKNWADEYKETALKLKEELDWVLEVFSAYLFSIEIKKRILDRSIPDALDQFRNVQLSEEERRREQHNSHLFRMDRLDNALFNSKDAFRKEFKNIQDCFPEIDINKILEHADLLFHQQVDAPTAGFSTAELCDYVQCVRDLLAKSDASVTIGYVANRFTPEVKAFILHSACSFLNINVAKILIKSKSDINLLKADCSLYGYFSETTPLFAVLAAIRKQKVRNPEANTKPAEELIQVLLDHGADPNARIFIQGEHDDRPAPMPKPGTEEYERQKISIVDLCGRLKERSQNYIPTEILDLIIDAGLQQERANKRQKI